MSVHIKVTKDNSYILTFNDKLNLDKIKEKAEHIAIAHELAVNSLNLELKELEDNYHANLQKLKEKAEYKYRVVRDEENKLAFKVKKEIVTPIEGLGDDNRSRFSHLFYVINDIYYATGWWPHQGKNMLFENGVTIASVEEQCFIRECLSRPEEVILNAPDRFKAYFDLKN